MAAKMLCWQASLVPPPGPLSYEQPCPPAFLPLFAGLPGRSMFGDNFLSGTAPEGWGQQGAFPKAEKVWLNFNNLTGGQEARMEVFCCCAPAIQLRLRGSRI